MAGLARRVHDSLTLQKKFEKLVDAQIDHSGQKTSLTRRVPTRWNSDLACLAAHIEFETPFRQLTSSGSSLKKYALSEAQWKLAKQLSEVLEVSFPNLFFVPFLTRNFLEIFHHSFLKGRGTFSP